MILNSYNCKRISFYSIATGGTESSTLVISYRIMVLQATGCFAVGKWRNFWLLEQQLKFYLVSAGGGGSSLTIQGGGGSGAGGFREVDTAGAMIQLFLLQEHHYSRRMVAGADSTETCTWSKLIQRLPCWLRRRCWRTSWFRRTSHSNDGQMLLVHQVGNGRSGTAGSGNSPPTQ